MSLLKVERLSKHSARFEPWIPSASRFGPEKFTGCSAQRRGQDDLHLDDFRPAQTRWRRGFRGRQTVLVQSQAAKRIMGVVPQELAIYED